MLTLAQRKVMSVSFSLLSRSPAMWMVWAALASMWMVFMGTPSLSEGCMRGAEAKPRWCHVLTAGPSSGLT
jgi:hypothetical protein